jgi:seryl-tRNA synthetase
MIFQYEEILTDLKKAKKTISVLKKERDYLKDALLNLQKSQEDCQKSFKFLQEENKVLRQQISHKLKEKEKESIIDTIKTLYKCITKISSQINYSTVIFELIQSIKKDEYSIVIPKICEDFLETFEKIEEYYEKEYKIIIDRPLETSFNWTPSTQTNQDSEQEYLINESCRLLETLDEQNSNILSISKKIKLCLSKNTFSPVFSLRVPSFHNSTISHEFS